MVQLAEHLEAWAGASTGRQAVAETVFALARASAELAELIAQGPLAGELGRVVGASDDGDARRRSTSRRRHVPRRACATPRSPPCASEEMPARGPARRRRLAVAIDPLDGSSNIDTNAPIGTISRSCQRAPTMRRCPSPAGDRQLAAGFVVYGPHTVLVLTVGAGVQVFAWTGAAAASC